MPKGKRQQIGKLDLLAFLQMSEPGYHLALEDMGYPEPRAALDSLAKLLLHNELLGYIAGENDLQGSSTGKYVRGRQASPDTIFVKMQGEQEADLIDMLRTTGHELLHIPLDDNVESKHVPMKYSTSFKPGTRYSDYLRRERLILNALSPWEISILGKVLFNLGDNHKRRDK